MELIRISDRKLKIMLTPTDMRHFELNPDTFCEDSVGMHRSFRHLLEEVKRQTGFEADDHQISVQYFPSREGGCEMFISRMPAVCESGCLSQPPTQSLQLRQKNVRNTFHRECAYRFSSLSDLLAVCHRLSEIGYIGSNSAYTDAAERYYLLLTVLAESPFTIPEELQFLSEYGTIENSSLLKIYLAEHGQILCSENAVYQLGVLA
ncbi:MAG: adaptor protein MecA [Clostridia bacterium]|nr:adaptor protein MecA [Clostridia bacterium]